MRFLLYNIRYGTGTGRTFHLPLPFSGYFRRTNGNFEKIRDFIQSEAPDIVGLVEVDSGSFRTDRSNQARTIARDLDHAHIFKSKYASRSMARKMPLLNKQGNAFLTNQQIVAKRFHYLNNGVKRLVIELELPEVSIFLVHLSLKFRHRQHQLQDLYAMVGQQPKPVIVAGDFNAFWGDRELSLFLAATGLENANGEGEPSHPARSPRRQLDFILHSPDIRVTDFRLPQVTFSDHIPLVCDFEVLKQAA
jgi:endonuclease/exonuclease/phosphatase family metal-dependent hydrolase